MNTLNTLTTLQEEQFINDTLQKSYALEISMNKSGKKYLVSDIRRITSSAIHALMEATGFQKKMNDLWNDKKAMTRMGAI